MSYNDRISPIFLKLTISKQIEMDKVDSRVR